jgi:hypothetical protein
MKSQQKKTPVKKQKAPKPQTTIDNDIVTISGDSLSSTYTIGPIDLSTTYIPQPTVYTSGTSSLGNITINSGTGYSYQPTWTTSAIGSGSSNTVNITGDGIVMEEKADIKIGNMSLKEFMLKMEERLAILVPDPKKLEQFEALKKAYEHYKLMEKLCQEKPVEEK